ncbi:cell division protein FtsQ [Aquabacterium olei]|uniref:Cell division protein FtsQ n=1 Tax=Aquabacterium olei TaxID=1296669 RepID=A0A2U8FW50_9BURK|nr:cell division protein FtsQ/DivIB [Aquabacterium olei]AWI54654.1 cell division protein FtsQ [Aquabacterium olei]
MLAAAALHAAPLQDETPMDVRWMNTAAIALAIGLVGLLLAAGLLRLSRLPYFQIDRIEIGGDLERNNLATVRANAVHRLQGSFFDIDLQKSREVFEAVPWVRKAVVRRVWPNELRVTLEEHRPAAYWFREDQEDQLVNTLGEVFDANLGDVEDERLPVLRGPAHSTGEESARMLAMLRALKPLLAPLGEIQTLRLTARGSWSVLLDSEARIELGRGTDDEVLARGARFVQTLPALQRQYPAPLEQADLRYPQGYAVKLRGTSTWADAASKPKPPPVRKPSAPTSP